MSENFLGISMTFLALVLVLVAQSQDPQPSQIFACDVPECSPVCARHGAVLEKNFVKTNKNKNKWCVT